MDWSQQNPASTVAGLVLAPFVLLYWGLSTVFSYGIWIFSHVRLLAVAIVLLIAVAATFGTGVDPLDHTVTVAIEEGGKVAAGVSSIVTDATTTDETKLRSVIHDRVNDERTQRGLPSLAYSQELEDVSQSHAEDMAEREYFSHDSPSGVGMGERYHRQGVSCSARGENIYKSTSSTANEEAFASEVVDAWMNSPNHRANILEGRFRSEAIGIAERGDEVYVTQNFC